MFYTITYYRNSPVITDYSEAVASVNYKKKFTKSIWCLGKKNLTEIVNLSYLTN